MRKVRTVAVVGSLVALVATGCGVGASTQDAAAALRETASRIDEIRSANLDMKLSSGIEEGDKGGFEVSGPVSLAGDTPLPVAKLEHRRFDGSEVREATFVSDGHGARIRHEGETIVVPEDELSGLREFTGKDGASGGERIDLSSWLAGPPEIAGGGQVGGVATDKVTAPLEVAEVLNGLLRIARAFGAEDVAGIPVVEGGEVERIRRSTREANLEVWTGQDDRLLRRLVMHIELGIDRDDVSEELKRMTNVVIDFELGLDEVNEPVSVVGPEG